jgi:hypothetical protein
MSPNSEVSENMSIFSEKMGAGRSAVQRYRYILLTVSRYVSSSVNCSVVSAILSLFTYVEIEFDYFAGGTFKVGTETKFPTFKLTL